MNNRIPVTTKLMANMRSLRESRGLTQLYVADKLGISRLTYLHMEAGQKKYIDREIINDLAKVLAVTADFLMHADLSNTAYLAGAGSVLIALSEKESQIIAAYRAGDYERLITLIGEKE